MAGLKLLQLEPLEGFGPPGLGTSRSAILTKLLRKIDRMALFIPSHLLLYVRGESAENRGRYRRCEFGCS